jgi:hypothetical protein
MKKIFGKLLGMKPKLNQPVNYFLFIDGKIFFLTSILAKK